MRARTITLICFMLCLLMVSGLQARSWNVISIDKAEEVKLGQEVLVRVNLNQGGFEIGSFQLSIYYDPQVLTLTNAALGDLFSACNWEYFSYEVNPCEGCDYNIITIEAISEYYDNGEEATCFEGPGQIATLVFSAGTDSALVCSSTPVGFYWAECYDNLFVNPRLDTLWYSDYVADFDGNNITGTPNFGGASKFCLEENEEVPYRFLDYVAGGVSFKCGLGYMCGDVNGDDKINLLDPVFLTAYLFKSGQAPDPIERGDVDCSGGDPILNDLVYLLNYIFNYGPSPCCDFK